MGMWAQQETLCEKVKAKLKEEGVKRHLSTHETRVLEALEGGANPKELMLLDLEHELTRIGAEYTVVGGDMNTCPPGCESSRRGETKPSHRLDSAAVQPSNSPPPSPY